MGHNLGMGHDFNDKSPRYFKGEDCNCQGLESYCGFPPLKWSECSRNDFLAHFNRIGESKWCLESKFYLKMDFVSIIEILKVIIEHELLYTLESMNMNFFLLAELDSTPCDNMCKTKWFQENRMGELIDKCP